MSAKLIFIAGGGTGGHIYPGIAIARALQKIDQNIQVQFVGSANGLETKIVPKEGFKLHLIAGGKLNFSGNLLLKIQTLLKVPLGLIQASILLARCRPNFVLGVGGYASGPFVLAASLMGYSTAIWEPNAHPGLANRWLSRFVGSCFVVFEDANKWLKNKKIFRFGMPVRSEFEVAQAEKKDDGKFHLLSFGGSQGARAISLVLSEALTKEEYAEKYQWKQGLQVVHQIGSLDFARFKKVYTGFEDQVEAKEFIYNMPDLYAWADLVVARGGASTLMELCAFGVPAIIVPLPLADDHQKKNAETLVHANAGRMVPQSELTADRLIQEIQELRGNPTLRRQMSQNMKALFQPNAAGRIAQQIFEQIGKA